MIHAKDLTKVFNKNQRKLIGKNTKQTNAVNGISLKCHPGRIFSLLGPNGAGKTTTLRILAGIISPTSGSVHINDKNLFENKREIQKKIGFLTGSTNLYKRLNADETIDFFGKIYDVPKDVLKDKKEYLFEKLGIDEYRQKLVGQMSTGMKQKLSIARTLIYDPDVLIFDEPTSGLDVITAYNIFELIKDSKKNNKIVIFSSHHMGEVELLCDDLAIINKGTIIYNDTFDAFKKEMKTSSLSQEFINRVNESSL